MKPAAKVGIVAAGYIGAFVIAWVAVSIYIAATRYVDRQTYSGMSAFGDSVVFFAAFVVAAVPGTGTALFFLRSRPGFWLTLSVISLAVAATALAALFGYAARTPTDSGSVLYFLSELTPLRILGAPFFAIFFALSTVIAPNRKARVSLIVATAIELTVFTYAILKWFLPLPS